MRERVGSLLRSRRRIGLLAALLLVIVAVACAGLLVGGVGPFAAETPETVYVYGSYGSPVAAGSPSTSPTAAGSATTSAEASASATGGAATATATAFHPPTAALSKPNLVHVSHTPLNVVCDVPFTINVTIRNAGPVAAGPANLTVSDSYTDSSHHSVASAGVRHGGLAAGASVTVPLTFTIGEYCGRPTDHAFWIRLDAAEEVDESNEDDNWLRLTHSVRAPNLYLTDLYIPPSPPCNAVNVGVRVNNNGTVTTTRDGLVRFTDTVGGHPSFSRVMYGSFPMIPAGTSRIVNVTFPPLSSYCGYLHTMTAVVNSSGVIGESSESDNSASTTFVPA